MSQGKNSLRKKYHRHLIDKKILTNIIPYLDHLEIDLWLLSAWATSVATMSCPHPTGGCCAMCSAVEHACVRVVITITIPDQCFNSGKCNNHNNNNDDNHNDNNSYNNIVMTIKLRLVNYYVQYV